MIKRFQINPNHNLFLKLGEQLLVPNLKVKQEAPNRDMNWGILTYKVHLVYYIQYQPFNLLMWAQKEKKRPLYRKI